MALVDTVRAHLARFHPPHLPRSRGGRELLHGSVALVDTVWAHLARFHPPHLPRSRGRRREVHWHLPVLRAITVLRWGTLAGVIYLIGWGALYEMRTSRLEADYFTRLDSKM